MTGSRIGRVSTVPSDLEGSYISQHVGIIRLKNTLLSKYLSFFMSLESGGQLQIKSRQYGQTKPGLNSDQVRSFKIPIPSLTSQHRFEEILSHLEYSKLKINKSIFESENLFNSLLQRAFRGEL